MEYDRKVCKNGDTDCLYLRYCTICGSSRFWFGKYDEYLAMNEDEQMKYVLVQFLNGVISRIPSEMCKDSDKVAMA